MKLKYMLPLCVGFLTLTVSAQRIEAFEVNEDWIEKVAKAAPQQPEAEPLQDRKMLVFGLHTGFKHWVIPHVDEVMKVLGEKSGAFEVELTKDVRKFSKKSLEQYDAVLINNACSVGPRRDLILDALEKDETLSQKKREKLAAQLEADLIAYVDQGGGLMVVHGGIVMQNNSMAFSEMVGGSFDYHPPQQEIKVELVDAGHPMVKAF
ncbi:MAG: ThuA domain-containing protein, partial [Bacteroidota bacterium]